MKTITVYLRLESLLKDLQSLKMIESLPLSPDNYKSYKDYTGDFKVFLTDYNRVAVQIDFELFSKLGLLEVLKH